MSRRPQASSRLRVLLVTPDFPPQGGGIQLLMERLVRNSEGIDFRVLTFGNPAAGEFDAGTDIDLHRVGSIEMNPWLSVPRINATAIAEARRFRPDAILSGHTIVSLGPLLARRMLGVPLVQYVHADEIRGQAGITPMVVRRAEATIAVSRYTRDLVVEAGADPARVSVIHPGVDLPAAVPPRRDGPPTLLTVASLIFDYKGHDVMTEALPRIRERVPGARWIVIGDGPLRGELEAGVRNAGLGDAVEFLGRVSDEERNAWLDRAQVLCMPSRIPDAGLGGEGFGIAYMEAAAHGLPSIGGNVAGALDAVRNGETGLLVDPGDAGAVADAVAGLLADSSRREQMGVAARDYAEQHGWPLIAARVEGLLREVAGC